MDYQSRYGFKLIEDFPENKLLPDPFIGSGGKRISSPAQWPAQRDYLLDMLDYFFYGPMPPVPAKVSGGVLKTGELYDGAALEEELLIDCGDFRFRARLIRPNRGGKFPVICACAIPFMLQSPAEWETVCRRDYAVALIDVNGIAFDRPEGGGPLYDAYPDYSGKAIMAWSWAVMRLIDYLERCSYVDTEKFMAAGCSRLGKQTLCAMIHDERIALAGVAGSGCGGFGSFRILGGLRGPEPNSSAIMETIGRMMYNFPHWFSDNMLSFSSIQPPYAVKKEYRLPFDMHAARALCAPRCVICSNALDDVWGNLYGDYGTWLAAGEVYRFLGAPDNAAFFYRPGPHGYDKSEWLAMLDFADLKFRGVSRPGLSLLNKGIFDVDKGAYFDWERPAPHV
jgi:hypothetical protein